jgi:hypothetical protein
MTDSSYVKMFIRQDTAMKGYTDSYKFLSGLNTFKLPVYFIDGCNWKISLGTKQLQHIAPDDKSKCPTTLFKFVSCPTGMIFDKKGKLVFKETGIDEQGRYEQRLTKVLNAVLAENVSKP